MERTFASTQLALRPTKFGLAGADSGRTNQHDERSVSSADSIGHLRCKGQLIESIVTLFFPDLTSVLTFVTGDKILGLGRCTPARVIER